MSIPPYTPACFNLTYTMAAAPAFTLVARQARWGWLAWAAGLLATLACALALLGVQALAGEGAPFSNADAVETSMPAPASAALAEKDSLDRDWALVPPMQFEAGLPLAAVDTVRPLRPQFQAPPPQRPPRARA